MTFADFIEFRRNELHLTLEQIAKYIGVGKGTVQKWKTGTIANIRRDKILKLAQILELNPLILLLDDIEYPLEQYDIFPITIKNDLNLSPHEKRLVTAYRNKPDFRNSVNKLLDIPNEEPTTPPKSTSKNIIPDMQSEFEDVKNNSPQKSKSSK